MTDTTRHAGKIRTVKTDRGFGFIRYDKADIFFHVKALPIGTAWTDALVGRAVTFEEQPTDDGRTRAAFVEFTE